MSRKIEIFTSLTLLTLFLIYLSHNIYNNVLSISTINAKTNVLEIQQKIKNNNIVKAEKEIKNDDKNIETKLKATKDNNKDKEIININKNTDYSDEKTVNKILNAVLLNNISNKEIEEQVLAKITKLKEDNDNEKNKKHKEIENKNALCENLYFQPNAEQKLKEAGCDIHSVGKRINNVKKGLDENYYSTVKYNNRLHPINIWKDRLEKIINKYGNDKNKVLDLLTIMTMECNDSNGHCFNGNDIGPFQINKVHKKEYNHSYNLYVKKKWNELFDYQLEVASRLIDSYRKGGCSDYNIKHYGVGNNYEEKRWRCIAFRYNGHPVYKFSYNKLGLKKRKIIENFLIEKGILEK